MITKVNGVEIKGKEFAFDDCHKFYILEDKYEKENAIVYGYSIYPIDMLRDKWEESCELRFIRNWNLDKQYVKQDEEAIFTYEREVK